MVSGGNRRDAAASCSGSVIRASVVGDVPQNGKDLIGSRVARDPDDVERDEAGWVQAQRRKVPTRFLGGEVAGRKGEGASVVEEE